MRVFVQSLALILLVGVVATGETAQAQLREPDRVRTPPPGLSEEPVAPPSQDEGPSVLEILENAFWAAKAALLEYHAKLLPYMPGYAAWLVIGLVLLSPILLIKLVRSRRRRKMVKRSEAIQKKSLPEPRVAAARNGKDERSEKKDRKGKKERRDRTKKDKKERDVEPLQLSPLQQLLVAEDGRYPSLHEAFVILGADELTVEALRRAISEEMDATGWAAMVQSQKANQLRPLRERWVKLLSTMRLTAWLSAHPLVTASGFLVNTPSHLEESELDGLTLTEPSGLGAELEDSQQEVLEQVRQALAHVYQHAVDPYVIFSAAHRAQLPALLGPHPEQEERGSYPLALLLHGIRALSHGAAAQLHPAQIAFEFQQAMDEHRQLVETDVPAEGCAVHALHAVEGGKIPGIGMLLAAVAGAAYSAKTVSLRFSKLTGDLPRQDQLDALEHLGDLVAVAMGDRKGGDGPKLEANLQRVLGTPLIDTERKRASDLLRAVQRQVAKQPLWASDESSPTPPDMALVHLHQQMVEQLGLVAPGAQLRMMEILDTLSYGGSQGRHQQLANRRLGYAIACLGMEVLKTTSMELLSAGREALSMVKGV